MKTTTKQTVTKLKTLKKGDLKYIAGGSKKGYDYYKGTANVKISIEDFG